MTQNTPPVTQSLEQKRAQHAWELTADAPSDEYLSLVRGAAATIMTSGLGQAIAFWISKDEDAHAQVADALAKWLLRDHGEYRDTSPNRRNVLDVIRTCDSVTYRQYTSEAMAFLQWLKRFAEAKRLK